MSLRSARRLPRQYNRPISKRTRALVDKRSSNRKQLRKEKMRRVKRKVQRIYFDWQRFIVRWFLVGILVALIFIFCFLLFSPVVKVRAVHIKRTDSRLDVETVQMALAPLFGQNTAFISELEVFTLLRDAIPDIDKVTITKEYPSDVSVSIKLDPLVARLIIVSPDEKDPVTESGSTLDFLTEEGMYITATDQDSDLTTLRLVDWGARPQAGNIILTQEFLASIEEAEQELLSQFGFVITQRTVFLRGQEFHLSVEREAESGVMRYVLWFDIRSTVDEHLQRYRTFLKALGPVAASEYIDLRLKDRVVYK